MGLTRALCCAGNELQKDSLRGFCMVAKSHLNPVLRPGQVFKGASVTFLVLLNIGLLRIQPFKSTWAASWEPLQLFFCCGS